MKESPTTPGHRELAKRDQGDRIAERGASGVTTQQIARRADVAIGTLYRYASTKAELLIMVQNEKFAAAIGDGLAAATAAGIPEAVTGELACEPMFELSRESKPWKFRVGTQVRNDRGHCQQRNKTPI